MKEDPSGERGRREAASVWVAILDRPSVGAVELQGFAGWRLDPANCRAWDEVSPGEGRMERFVVRPETGRFKVIDIWTGETAVVAMARQDHLSLDDAAHMAGLLNLGINDGGRAVRP